MISFKGSTNIRVSTSFEFLLLFLHRFFKEKERKRRIQKQKIKIIKLRTEKITTEFARMQQKINLSGNLIKHFAYG